MAKPSNTKQIDLLFGVAGENSINGASGRRIKSQLDGLVRRINQKPYGAEFTLDTTKAKEKLIDVENRLNTIKATLNEVSNMGLSLENVGNAKPNTANGKSGSFFVGDKAKSPIKQIGDEAQKTERKLERLEKAYKNILKYENSTLTEKDKIQTYVQNLPEVTRAAKSIERLEELEQSFRNGDGSRKLFSEINKTDLQEYIELQADIKNKTKAAELASISQGTTYTKLSTKISKLTARAWEYRKSLTKLGQFPELQKELDGFITKISAPNFTGNIASVNDEFLKLQQKIRDAGVETETLGDVIETKISDRIKYLVGQFAIDFVVQGLRQIYDNVVLLDSAMTELRKVTQATAKEYDIFLSEASVRAKELGASLFEVVNATADYARLGYSLEEASMMADTAIVYSNVGDGLADIDEATQHLISTMTAFQISADKSMHIVDIFNEVANNYAVSASDIGEGLQRSAAAMFTAGNSLEETVAIFTAANTIQQDAAVVGTALKTMSMRLTETKTDMEAAGEDTEGMAESISSLRQEVLALTGVDIQKNENEYKSTYEILRDIAEVWDDIDGLDRQNILNLLFGKRQGSIGSGLLENFDIAEKALKTALASEGSALRENTVYLESIQGHLDQLAASFQVLSSNMLDSELVKFGVDTLRVILDLLNGILEVAHSLGDALGLICEPLGQIVNLIGTLMVVAGGASLLDGFFGFKHVKNILNIVSAAKDYLKILKQIKTVESVTNTSEAVSKIVDKVLESPDTKYNKETMKAVSKIVDKIKEIPTILAAGHGVGGASIFGGVLIALPLILAGIGAWVSKLHDVKTTTEKINKQHTEYASAKGDLESLNKEFDTNKARLEELQKIEVPSVVEQEEINLLERKNALLEEQIKLQQKLVSKEQNDVYDSTVDAIDKTWGYTRYGKSSGMQYYSQRQGEIFQQEIDRIQGYIDAERAKGEKANQDLIDYYLEQQLKYEEQYVAWQQAIVTAREGLAGATDKEHVEAREFLDSILNWINYQNGESPVAELLSDSRFVEIIDLIKQLDNVSIRTIEDKFGPEAASVFSQALLAAGVTLDQFIELCNEADDASDIEGKITIDTESISVAAEATQKLSASFKSMAEAFKEQNENGSLSVDTILDVIDAGYAAALVVDRETGAVKLDADMYKYLAQMKINDQIISLNTQKTSLMDSKLLLEEAVAAGKAAEGYKTLAETKAALATVEAHIASLEAQIAALNSIDLSQITQGIYGVGNAASDAKSKLSNLQSGMENLLSQTISWLKQEYNDAQEAQENYYESQIDALEDAKDAAKDRWDAEKEAIEDAKDSYNDLIDAQIELLKRQKEADDYAKNRAEKEDAVADIENQLLAIENDDSIEAQKMRLELQEQLKKAKDELEELQSDREYELREQALQDEKDRYNDEIDAKLDAIEKQSEAEEKAYQDRIDRLQKYLDAVRDSEKTEAQWRAEAYDWIQSKEEALYQELIEWNRIYGVTTLPLSGNRH